MNKPYFELILGTGQAHCKWCKRLIKKNQRCFKIQQRATYIHTQAKDCPPLKEALLQLNVLSVTELFSLNEKEELMEQL